ncbi:hypothetical protein ABEK56_27500, partial [Klebsiella pneumoniae]
MGSCAAPSAKGDDKFITTDYLQQCPFIPVPGGKRPSWQSGCSCPYNASKEKGATGEPAAPL